MAYVGGRVFVILMLAREYGRQFRGSTAYLGSRSNVSDLVYDWPTCFQTASHSP